MVEVRIWPSHPRIAAMTVLLVAILTATACGYHGDINAVVKLKNDLGQSVAVDPCGDFHCHRLVGSVRERLLPSGTLSVNISVDGPPTHYRVFDSSGTSRCLSLDERKPSTQAVVLLSAAVGCTQALRHAVPSNAVVEEGAAQPLAEAVLGWALYLLVFGVGSVSIVLVILRGHRYLQDRNISGSSLALSTVAIGIGAFFGAWVVIDLYWLARGASRFIHRPVSAT